MVRFIRTTTDSEDFQKLCALLDTDLNRRYDIIQDLYTPYNTLQPVSTALIAYDEETPVACGCFKGMESTVEIKRMYVHPAYRRQAVAQYILELLEQWAMALGYNQAILETGLRQPESIRFYEKMGYTPIKNYAPYMDMVESICYGKSLV
jgi:putative acetyltransferase